MDEFTERIHKWCQEHPESEDSTFILKSLEGSRRMKFEERKRWKVIAKELLEREGGKAS
jgi:hypothetical protein